MRFVSIALAAAFLVGFATEETYLLKLNLNEGDKYSYIIDTDQQITMTIMEQEMEMEQSIKMYMPSVVKSVSSKETTVGQMISRVIFKQSGEAIGENYCDTDSEEKTKGNVGSALYSGFSMVVNKPMIVAMQSNGKVTDVDVTSFPKAMQKELKGSLKNSQGYFTFSKKAIAIGGKWSSSYSMELQQTEYEFSNLFTLDSITEERAYVSLVSTPVMHKGNVMEGEQSGTLEYDRKTGIMVNGLINQDLKIAKLKTVENMHIISVIKMRGKFD